MLIRSAKEKIFKFPSDIVGSRMRTYLKNIAAHIGAVFSLGVIYVYNLQVWGSLVKMDKIFLVVMVLVVAVFVLTGPMYILLLFNKKVIRFTEIIVDEERFIRKIKNLVRIFKWRSIAKVTISNNMFGGKRVWVSDHVRGYTIFHSDLIRFDELVSIIKKNVSPDIIKEKKYSIIEILFWISLSFIYGIIYACAPGLRPLVFTIIKGWIFVIYSRFPVSDRYGTIVKQIYLIFGFFIACWAVWPVLRSWHLIFK